MVSPTSTEEFWEDVRTCTLTGRNLTFATMLLVAKDKRPDLAPLQRAAIEVAVMVAFIEKFGGDPANAH